MLRERVAELETAAAEAESAREVLAYALAHLLRTCDHPLAAAAPPPPPLSPALLASDSPDTHARAARGRVRAVAENEAALDSVVRAAFVRESVAIAAMIVQQAPPPAGEASPSERAAAPRGSSAAAAAADDTPVPAREGASEQSEPDSAGLGSATLRFAPFTFARDGGVTPMLGSSLRRSSAAARPGASKGRDDTARGAGPAAAVRVSVYCHLDSHRCHCIYISMSLPKCVLLSGPQDSPR